MEIGNTPSPSTKIRTRFPRQSLQLSEETIEQILAKLPVKSLLRFRCVSKSWRSLISSKRFIKRHHQNSIKNPSFPQQSVILHNMRYRPMQCSLHSLLNESSTDQSSPLDDASNPFKVVGCCNGLVCVLEQPGNFYIWNPSTRISKNLPRIGNRSHVEIEIYGFGCVESSDEYKVFALVHGFYNVGKVYSSKTKSWKTLQQYLNLPLLCEEGVFVGGKLHWYSKRDIVTFDLKSEVYGIIKTPFIRGDYLNKGLGIIGGCLCLLYYHGRGIRVLVMKEYGAKEYSWERVATLGHVLELLERPFSAPFAVGTNGEIFVFYGTTFLVYSPQDNVFRCPKIFCRYESHHLYVESLVSPAEVA